MHEFLNNVDLILSTLAACLSVSLRMCVDNNFTFRTIAQVDVVVLAGLNLLYVSIFCVFVQVMQFIVVIVGIRLMANVSNLLK